jgi:transcriptional regulator with XRE-family HTH domain
MTLAEQFGRNLRKERTRLAISQDALAKAAGLTTDAVQKIELGKRRPRIDTVLKLAQALEIDPCEFFEGLRP